ncbi:MAG TPA: hypothetical protein VF316_06660 [Polyangiaceae bacterium]
MGLGLEPKTGDAVAAGAVYKVVELSTVTDVEIERVLNEWVPQGWTFEGIQFAMGASKRPAMAFVLFTRAK